MPRSSPEPAVAVEGSRDRIDELCALAGRAAGETLEVVPYEAQASDGRVDVGAGWAARGSGEAGPVTAALELARRALKAESEAESLCAEILERYEEATLVYRLSQRLATVQGVASIARMFVEEAVESMEARAGELWLVQSASTTRAASVPDQDNEPGELREQGPLSALAQGRPWRREGGADAEPLAAIPLPGPGRSSSGVLVLRGRSGGRGYRSGELKLLAALASLASAFIRNEQIIRSTLRADARDRNDEIARAVQLALFPATTSAPEDLTVAAGCSAGHDTGRDLYCFLRFAGDVPGLFFAESLRAGVGSAMQLAALRGAVCAEAPEAQDCAALLARLARTIGPELASRATALHACALRFAPGSGRVEFSSAGRVAHVLLRARGAAESISTCGSELGRNDGAAFKNVHEPFEAGDLLAVCSRGLIDAGGAQGRPFGLDRVRAVLQREGDRSVEELRTAVLAELYSHCGERPPKDDVTLIVARPAGPGRPTTEEREP